MELSIHGIGIASSLGVGAVGACAAARAGISRASELDFSVFHAVDNDVEPIVGHCVPGLTRGFEGDGRLLRLAQLAFDDLLREAPDWDGAAARTGLWLVLPTEPPAEGVDIEQEDAPGPEVRLDDAAFAARLGQLLEHGVPREHTEVVRAGHAGAGVALERAMGALESGRFERCLVGAIDSLVDEPTLTRLAAAGRLKGSGNPAGLSPGEAAVFLLLEPRAASGRAAVSIRAVVLGTEEHAYDAGEAATGVGISNATRALVGRAGLTAGAAVVVSDQNGEVYRGTEWGYLLHRLAGDFPWLGSAPLILPAISFGDTGAASGLLTVASAAHELRRTRTAVRSACVLSSADSGERAALALERSDG